jgi:Protein of unknown function (DUF4230)
LIGTRIRWLILGLLLGLSFAFLWPAAGSAAAKLSATGVVEQIQPLNSLVTVKYVLQKAIGIEEQKLPFGTEKILLFMNADVLAGVELNQITTASIRSEGGRIAISLPPARILHVVVDDRETRVWDRGITWWTPWVPANPDLERQARLKAKEAIEKAALDMGILDKAKENAQANIRSLLMGIGAKSVVFVPGS